MNPHSSAVSEQSTLNGYAAGSNPAEGLMCRNSSEKEQRISNPEAVGLSPTSGSISAQCDHFNLRGPFL
jgi:hypothetical protein